QNGGTLMTFSGEGKPGGFFKMAEGILRKRLESQFEKNLNRLKALLEG
ncbi:MAG: ATPase, partial [Aliifodinibius sp.]|nr:ATPase [Fodinibius sp.]